MEKILTFSSKTSRGVFNYVIGTENRFLEKTASQYHPTIAAYINNAKTIPGKTQILLTALGAGEYWGCNANGDYFPEKALAYEGDTHGYKTFVLYAKAYKHHVNKDPNNNYGEVALAVYNPTYHRVELIVLIDNEKAPDIVARIEAGENVEWSMGCRVPYDTCSICGNKAPTRKEYCIHARYYLGQIDPESGKQVYVINDFPRFHDISQVVIGADKIAKTLLKVASDGTIAVGSAELAEKSAARVKVAEIEKEIPASDPPASQESLDNLIEMIPELKAREPRIPTPILNRLSDFPLSNSMSTLASLGILPKPQEFQKIVLIRMGHKPLAEELDRRNVCFHPDMVTEPEARHEQILGLNPENFDPYIMEMIKSLLPQRSCAVPHMAKRIIVMVKQAQLNQSVVEDLPIFIKTASDVAKLGISSDKFVRSESSDRKPIGILPLLMAAAGLYAAFSKGAPGAASNGLVRLIEKHPGIAAALGIGVAGTLGAVAGIKRSGHHTDAPYVNPDISSASSFIAQNSENPLLKNANELRNRATSSMKKIFVGIPAVYLASGMLQKHKDINPEYTEGGVKSFVRRNPDIIGAGLALDAVAGLRGKGTYQLAKTLTPKLKSILGELKVPNLNKEASVGAVLNEAAKGMIFPLAMGSNNLPSRIAGGLFDAAVINTAAYMYSKKKRNEQGTTPLSNY